MPAHHIQGRAVVGSARGKLAPLRDRLGVLGAEITSFWWPRAYDRNHGGFHGSLDREGRPCAPSDKTLVQQARHLWALSMYLERRPGGSSQQQLIDMAHGTREFLAHFADPRDGRFFWEVDRAGSLRDPAKILYGQGFAIFALSQYGRTLGVSEAVAAALRCFDAIETLSRDSEHGGYHETGDPHWLTGGASKDTNTHIHLLEALTALHDVSAEPSVAARLSELVELVSERLLQPQGHVHPFFEADFRPFGRPHVSYGHDIETAWLLIDAARSLGWDIAKVARASLRMGKNAVDFGFDHALGGLFEEGVPQGPVTSREKVWWAQFETLPGLWWLFRLTGEDIYLERLDKALAWLEGPARDDTFGEWYWSVGTDGGWGSRGPGKGNVWKTTYHNLRAVLYVSDWMGEQLVEPAGGEAKLLATAPSNEGT